MAALSIRLPDDIALRINRLTKLNGHSKTFYITDAILEHLDDLEDIFLAEKRLERIRTVRAKTIPLKDVMKRQGLDG